MQYGHGYWGPGPGRRSGGGFFGRGGVKYAILELLREKPRHGYDIIREIEERSGGAYSPSPGVIYPTLQALEDQDYVKSSEQEGKKVYAITESGLAYLEGHKERWRERHGGRGPHGHGPGSWWMGQAAWDSDWGSGGAARASAAGSDEPAAESAERAPKEEAEPDEEEGGPGWRYGARSAHGASGGGFTAWFTPGDVPDLMKELRWFFGDFASAIQRTVTDPDKIKEIREVLREAKHKIDEIVMR